MNRDVCEHFNPVDLPCDKCKSANVQKSTLRGAAQQALEALEDMLGWQSLAPQMIQESAKGRAYALRASLAEPVQEGCDHCNQPLYAAVKCRMCGRVTEPLQEPVAWSHINGTSDTKWHPPQRQPLTEEEISSLWDGHVVPVFGKNGINPIVFTRAIERAHGIGGNA